MTVKQYKEIKALLETIIRLLGHIEYSTRTKK